MHLCPKGSSGKLVKRLALLILVSLSLSPARAENLVASMENSNAIPPTEWIKESSGQGLVIHSRMRLRSGLKEFKGVGVIDASPRVVFAVLDDSEAYSASCLIRLSAGS